MKALSADRIFAAMSDIDPDLVREAMPPSFAGHSRAEAKDAAKPRPLRAFTRWLETGWAAVILSVVVATGVLTGIILAGRMGDADPPPAGADSESESTVTDAPPKVEGEAYTLQYHANGDGTCRVTILPTESGADLYSVYIPARSPDGDTVTSIENNFNIHMLLPSAMMAADFEQYIKAPMEAHFGITEEEAEAIQYDPKASGYEAGFKLRRYLAYYAYKPAGTLETIYDSPDFRPVDFDAYLLEPTMTDEEKRAMHDVLLQIGLTAAQAHDAHDRLILRMSRAGSDISVPPYVPSWGIRTITLPATLQSLPEGMFEGWMDLEEIIYQGSSKMWDQLTGGEWDLPVQVLLQATDEMSYRKLLLDTQERQYTLRSGILHWSCELWQKDGEPPTLVSADMVYATLEELIAGGDLQTVELPVGTFPTVHHMESPDWQYTLSVTVYDLALTEIARGTPDALATLDVGDYYVELLVSATGPYLAEVDGNEAFGMCFTFRLSVAEALTTPAPPRSDTAVPLASAYVGYLDSPEQIFDKYPAADGLTCRWRVERRLPNGGFMEEIVLPEETFVLNSVSGIRLPTHEDIDDPESIYYFHLTVYEDGEWRSIGYVEIEIMMPAI